MTYSRPTLADVARLAGVSLGSASRALSVPDRVKPKTLEAVHNAVAQLGYIRDGAARALASRRSQTIAAVYPTLNNPIFAHSTHSIQQTLWAQGYQLLIVSHEYHTETEVSLIRATLEKGVDGIIMVGTDHEDAVFSLLRQYKLPYVLTWSVDGSQHPYCVGISNFDAAYQLARLALGKGHTRLGICGGTIVGNERARYRRAGILAAVHEAGLTIPAEWIIEHAFSYEGGRQAIRHIWQMSPRPTVVLFGTDLQAMGALHECRRLGIRVPDDISLIGFDGLEEAAMMQPELTTIRIPDSDIGTRAAHIIVDLLADLPVPPQQPLRPTLIPGASLGAPPAGR
ncbi:LacI family DNA-binding transcriptional regulator [Castellaniella caeni]|uniref:LacI family DNA-binding transcriptional regulator n=1 Tax=Castellaniella caeni TaxID=266123 RepID=UPI0008296147|nr:LacI family DNA-binding transcriptional regulator [Castellaniella caeni]